MSITQYDPDNWLLSATRSLKEYVESQVNLDLVTVEMSYPDTEYWTKETPLEKTLIHFEIDDQDAPTFAFGHPGKEVFIESPDNGVTPNYWRIDEAQLHLVNFDVGVWASQESGGATARLKYHQLLVNLFSVAGAKESLQDATGGIWVVSFAGGRHTTDRINDLPVWRAHDMTLIARVYSRHIGTQEVVPDAVDFVEDFTIADDSGNQTPVE